jgi:hypothetical protein
MARRTSLIAARTGESDTDQPAMPATSTTFAAFRPVAGITAWPDGRACTASRRTS